MRTFALCILLLSISAFADDFHWAGTWNVEPISQDANCCFPDNGVVVTMDGDKKAIGQGRWAQKNCPLAGLGWKESATISDDGKSVKLAFPFGNVQVVGTLTQTNDVDTVAYLSVVNTLQCTANFKRVKNPPAPVIPTPARDFSGIWQVKPTGPADVCCYPKSPVKIHQDGNMATAHIDWDATEACKGYVSIDQTVEVKEDNKVTLPFYNRQPPVSGDIIKTGETAKFALSVCTADFTRDPNTAISAGGAGGASGAPAKNSGPGAGLYIGIVIAIIVVAIIAYFLYSRHKASKLENTLNNYQRTPLNA